MPFDVTHAEVWESLGIHTVYRYLEAGSAHKANAPWATEGGRFDDGIRLTLYVSLEPAAAIAEYLRRHPELIDLQDGLKLELYEFELGSAADGCDVSTRARAERVGVAWDDLRSSDPSPNARYQHCRLLADGVDDAGGVGIAFPSAAYDDTTNLVLFHDSAPDWWHATDPVGIPLAQVDPDRLHAL